jgi:hypothetical protein
VLRDFILSQKVIDLTRTKRHKNTKYEKEDSKEDKRNRKYKVMKFEVLPVIDLFLD